MLTRQQFHPAKGGQSPTHKPEEAAKTESGKPDSPYESVTDSGLNEVNGILEAKNELPPSEFWDGEEEAQEVPKPVVLPKGPPPMLPPRKSAEAKPVEADFEDLDLEDSRKN